MTQIYILPTKLGSLQTQRLIDSLSREVAMGTELGSRAYHIRAIGSSLMELCDTLQGWTDTLPVENGISGGDPAWTACQRLIEEARCLAGIAQCYSV